MQQQALKKYWTGDAAVQHFILNWRRLTADSSKVRMFHLLNACYLSSSFLMSPHPSYGRKGGKERNYRCTNLKKEKRDLCSMDKEQINIITYKSEHKPKLLSAVTPLILQHDFLRDFRPLCHWWHIWLMFLIFCTMDCFLMFKLLFGVIYEGQGH